MEKALAKNNIAAGHRGSFAHAGGSTASLNLIPSMPFKDIDEIYNAGSSFFRSADRIAPYNLYTDINLLKDGLKNIGAKFTFPAIKYPVGNMQGGTTATEASIRFRGSTSDTVFSWDNQRYRKYVNGNPVLLENGEHLTADNVIILFAPHTEYRFGGETVIEPQLIGSGTALFYRDGLMWHGFWEKEDIESPFSFTTADGYMLFKEGSIWVLVGDRMTISHTEPQHGNLNVPVDQEIKITFTKTITAGPGYDQIEMLDSYSNAVGFNTSIQDNILTIVPYSYLDIDTQYTVTIPANAVVDEKGDVLAGPYTFRFITGEGYDFSLQLGSGWNLLSIPKWINSFAMSEDDILAWLSYGVKDGNAGWLNIKEEIQFEMENPASAVFIKTKKPTEIRFKWKDFGPQDTFAGKQLTEGWNLIGTGISDNLKNILSPYKNDLMQIYAPNAFNSNKESGYHLSWSSPLLDLSEWSRDNQMYRLDGYWVYLQGQGVLYTTVVDPADVERIFTSPYPSPPPPPIYPFSLAEAEDLQNSAETSETYAFSLLDDSPILSFPALCYGNLMIDGEPAAPGTIIEARVDGETIGSITITEDGIFGGPGLETKLAVYGNDLEGKLVKFYALIKNEDSSYTEVEVGETLFWGYGHVLEGMSLQSPPDFPVDECFIATAAFGSKLDPAVALLRQFRDAKLLTNKPGQAFVNFYYNISPPIAKNIAGNNILRCLVRLFLLPVIAVVYLVMNPLFLLLLLSAMLACFILYSRRKSSVA